MKHEFDLEQIDYDNSNYELDIWSSCFNPIFHPPPEVIKEWNLQFDDWDEPEPTLKNTSVYFTEDGTNFDRPAFQRMMDDVDAGRINCIITKYLSRFGREHVMMDYYLEFVFPEKNIRYIAGTESTGAYHRADEGCRGNCVG